MAKKKVDPEVDLTENMVVESVMHFEVMDGEHRGDCSKCGRPNMLASVKLAELDMVLGLCPSCSGKLPGVMHEEESSDG